MVASLDTRGIVTELSAAPASELGVLLGERAGPGLRRAVMAVVEEPTSLLATVLMDLPIAGALSSYARLQAGRWAGKPPATLVDEERTRAFVDSCAGWADDGPVVTAVRAGTYTQPAAPAPVPVEDLSGWHDLGDLPVGWIQRRRRIDVARGDGSVTVDAAFRDTWSAPDGVHAALHEWELRIDVDGTHDDATVTRVVATPRSLPFDVCPTVGANVDRLIGTRIADLRSRTRDQLGGPDGCTHLNDLLAAVPSAVAAAVARPRASA